MDVMVSYEQIVTETGEMENFLQVAAFLYLPASYQVVYVYFLDVDNFE